MEVYKDGVDQGWLEDQNWWLNPDNPNSFLIQKAEDNYPEEYFAKDHVSEETVNNLFRYVCEYYYRLTNNPLKTVVEFGCGGGWFLKKFLDYGIDAYGYEYSNFGISKSIARGIELKNINKIDLRLVIPPLFGYKYNMAICTEVAEHIEIPFSAMLVYNLITHSDLIWFSTEEPNTNRPHIHHPNERPYKFWIKLFDFYNYGYYMLPDDVYNACEGRGRMIFYNRKTIKI